MSSMSAGTLSNPCRSEILLPALRINVDNPSSCLPCGHVPPQFKSLFVGSRRPSNAAYSGSALSETGSIKYSEPDLELPSSKKIVWSPPVMPLRCTALQLQRWWISGASHCEFIPPENTELKAQIEALCGGNVNNLEREREQADPFADIVASDRRIFGIPECVAYAQLDVESGFLLSSKDRIFFADVCGLGAFTEFVITRRGKAAKGWMIRSAGDDSFSLARMNPIARGLLPAQVDSKFAPSDADCRSLINENVRLEVIDYVRAVSSDGLDVVAASWAPEFCKEKARSVAVVCARFLAQLLTALDLCAQGGTLIVRLFTSTDPVVLGVLPLVASCFESSAIVKPLAVNPYSAVRFLVCKGMMQHMDQTSGIRNATSVFLATAVKKLEAGDSAWLAGPSPLCTPPLASKFIAQSNDGIDAMVLRMWTRAAAFKNGNGATNSQYSNGKFRSQLLTKLAEWAVPDKSLLQQKLELKHLGFEPSEIDSMSKNLFMNSARAAQLQTTKAVEARPPAESQQHKAPVPSPRVPAFPSASEVSAPQQRLSSTAAAPISQAPKAHSSASSSSTNTSRKKRNDAEAFLEANELEGTDSSALTMSSSKQLPSSNTAKPAAASRQHTSQVDSTPSVSSSVAAPKAAAKSIPAPLLAAAKKAGMSITQPSTKSTKVSTGSPAISAAPNPVSGPSKSEMAASVVAPAINSSTKESHAKMPNEDDLRKSTCKTADKFDGHLMSSSNAAPSIPVRRKRVVDSDDSDDAPASLPSAVATPFFSDAPAASPALDASFKKPRVSILSSRDLAVVTADVAVNVEESAAGPREVEELLESKTAAPVACVSAAASAIDSSAPAKSVLKIALKRRISD